MDAALAAPPAPGRRAKRSLRVGIIEFLTDTRTSGLVQRAYARYLTKQFSSITPQAVAVWCRELGHTVHYTTFYGQADLRSLLPNELDVLFVSAYTRSSGLAYALAKIFRREGVVTVIGGPHAKSYPADCLRYFDIVVKDCDRELVADILGGQFDHPSVVTSGRPFTDIPGVEERMPEIRAASFYDGRATPSSMVALLSSVGCPYTCNFCTDWNNKYITLSPERLETDLEYLSAHLPQVLVAYHDPNFGVRFDETMAVMERIPKGRRNRYVMESSLAIMKASRLERLRETNCVFVAPGVESWADYSNKAGVGAKQGREKLEQIVAHFDELSQYVPGLQANFLFGLDGDRGPEPVELTKEFIRRSPKVWPTINIPTPLGGTPLFDELYREGRILKAMPFALYFTLYYTVTTLKHYHPIEYYDHLVDIYSTIGSLGMLAKRITARTHPYARFLNSVRTLSDRNDIGEFKTMRRMLATDRQFLAFHEGTSNVLPEYHQRRFEERLGAYAELFPRAERAPMLDPIAMDAVGRTSVTVPRSDLAPVTA
jgi:radical SAM superfamily enzyme YgiQ (UPF0313 family)